VDRILVGLGKRITTLEYDQIILNRRIISNRSKTPDLTDDAEDHEPADAAPLGASVELQNHTSLPETLNVLEGILVPTSTPGDEKNTTIASFVWRFGCCFPSFQNHFPGGR